MNHCKKRKAISDSVGGSLVSTAIKEIDLLFSKVNNIFLPLTPQEALT